MVEKLTGPQLHWLRALSGERVEPRLLPKNRWLQELTTRALIDRGLITRESWNVTDKGRAALQARGDKL